MLVNGALVVQTLLTLDPVPYYVGLSGATGGGYFMQAIYTWTMDTVPV